jgi:hypothetical protein
LDASQLPFWIEDLLTRMWFSCNEPGHVHLRQGWACERVIQVVDAHENGRQQLRAACITYLQHEDARVVERALTCLLAIGLSSEANAVEPLLEHPEEAVRKAARTCLFELRRRPAES